MSLLSQAVKFARSPKGRELTEKAKHMAKDPETRRKIDEMRGKVARKEPRH